MTHKDWGRDSGDYYCCDTQYVEHGERHEELERKVAQTHELSQLMDKLSSAKIEMPLEDTHRPVGFDEPKKNPP